MASVFRATAVWNGFTGAPGYTKFSYSDVLNQAGYDACANQMRTFFDSLKGLFHTTWTIQVQNTIQEFDSISSQLLAEHNVTTTPAVVTGTAVVAPYAGGSGASIGWKTGLFFYGRRLKGRTYLVPLAASVYESDGTLTAAAISTIKNAADALIAATGAEFCIWGKKFDTSNPPIQIGGGLAPAQSSVVKDAASQLRSRRN